MGVHEQALGTVLGEEIRPRRTWILHHGGILRPTDAADSGTCPKANRREGIVLNPGISLKKLGFMPDADHPELKGLL